MPKKSDETVFQEAALLDLLRRVFFRSFLTYFTRFGIITYKTKKTAENRKYETVRTMFQADTIPCNTSIFSVLSL